MIFSVIQSQLLRGDLMGFWSTIQPILMGLATGLGAGLIGYIKAIPEGKKFDLFKAGPVIIFSGIVGAYAAFNGLPINTAQGVLSAAGIGILLNYLWSAIWKFINNVKDSGKLIVSK
jgi:hypothetical protein